MVKVYKMKLLDKNMISKYYKVHLFNNKKRKGKTPIWISLTGLCTLFPEFRSNYVIVQLTFQH